MLTEILPWIRNKPQTKLSTDTRMDEYSFTFHGERVTWDAARAICAAEGASLAMEYTHNIHEYMMQNFGDEPMWIGITNVWKVGIERERLREREF